MNLFMMLGALGPSYELCGQQLFPIGTVYDPFVCRGLDALIYDLYNQAKLIVVGTPSGITLEPRGRRAPVHHHALDRHRAAATCSSTSPCFGREVEWMLLEALRQIARPRSTACPPTCA